MMLKELEQAVEKQKEHIETPVATLFKKFAKHRDVTLVYGDPIEVGLTKVIPVAKVRYGFGGGGDGAGNNGGGGGFQINPVGVYEVTPEHVKFKSTRSKMTVVLTLMTCGLFWLIGRNMGKFKKH
ncbi:spore germination protein GerW family protein [Sporosarcina thermotolerans]|uniref:Spore germination protein GerW family protein n=1 Tax=Sporosarcina thermotolerans TaxID=633404 RepID=A0AAW9A7Q0_9BACL|nr:spore germination protein GerW family protein [Sporosarcina thermotolerans]MDW0117646.1 spore germination protein GerW family protein [Sporosarcina thermotolerans]WHT49258.1 spore germination protein GerW family protein [Sporosarcina thermotolerans]